MTLDRLTTSGERVRAARDLRGWTQGQVVAAMSTPLSVAGLSQIEAGKVRPSPPTVQGLAEALGVPPTYFTQRRTVPATPFFRDLRATPVAARKRAAALSWLLADFVELLETHVQLPDVRLPDYSVAADADPEQVEEAADAVRGEWDLGADPIPHVVLELERHGVPVARLSLGERGVDGFAAWSSQRPLVILSDDKESYTRSRFDAAHELGHLIMHRHATPGEKLWENQAHKFASCLLMPREVALDELPRRIDRQGWMALASLKQEWGLSIGAMLFRARELHLLAPEAYTSAMRYMSMKGWRTREPGDRELGLPEAPRLLERAAKQMEIETKHDLAHLIADAGLPVKETLELFRQATDQRPIVAL